MDGWMDGWMDVCMYVATSPHRSSKRAAATHHNVSNLQEHHHLPVISKAGVLRAQSEPLDAHSQGGGAGAGSHPQKRGGAKKKAKARA